MSIHVSVTLYILFSHAMLVDQRTEGVVVPLNFALESEGKLELANSKSELPSKKALRKHLSMAGSLSEMGVLGVSQVMSSRIIAVFYIPCQFEYGVSWERPDILPIWEAQVAFT